MMLGVAIECDLGVSAYLNWTKLSAHSSTFVILIKFDAILLPLAGRATSDEGVVARLLRARRRPSWRIELTGIAFCTAYRC